MPLILTEKRILVLLNNVSHDQFFLIQEGIQRYCNKVYQRTQGQFKLMVDYVGVDAEVFKTIQSTNSEGQNVVFVDPIEIELAAENVAETKVYQSICLLFDPNKTVGPRATNPSDNGKYFQIPNDWIGEQVGQWKSEYSAQYFFAHENSHSDFFSAEQPDKTHNPNPHTTQTDADDPTDFYIDLLLELKPYWAKLGEVMYKVEFVHLGITEEYGFLESTPFTKIYHRCTEKADLIFQADKFGVDIFNGQTAIDYSSAKEIIV